MSAEVELWMWGGTALFPGQPNKILDDAAIGITDGHIVFIGTRKEARPSATAKKVDSTGCLVLPGLVNGHTHVGMSLMRGLFDDLPLDIWLRQFVFPTEQKWCSAEFVYWASLLSCAEMIRAGITVFNDMYYFEDQTARAAHEAGLRMVACQSLTEESDSDKTSTDIEGTFDRFLKKVADFPLITPGLGPHAIYSVSEESWRRVIRYAEKNRLGIHLHLSETQQEVDETLKKHGKTPTQFFEDIGLWNQRVAAAHAVCMTPGDIEILARHKVGVVHNPESNMKIGTGIAPVVELRAAGIQMAFGTDSAVSNNNLDMLGEAGFAAKLQSHKYGPGRLKAEDVVRMLTVEGARAIGLATGIGAFDLGSPADIIAVDVTGPHAVPLYHPYSHLVYAAHAQDVKHSMVNGQLLMENRTLLTLDEQEIVREAASWARRICAKL